MTERHDGELCHVKDCGAPATVTCEGCSRRYCDEHVRTFTIERREQSSRPLLALGAAPRLPTHTESYTLCARCGARPFQRVELQPPTF